MELGKRRLRLLNEARRCRAKALLYPNKPEERLLLNIAVEFERLGGSLSPRVCNAEPHLLRPLNSYMAESFADNAIV